MTVVYASVVVKWFFPEVGSQAAQKLLLNSEELAAPALVRMEVCAAITRKLRLGEMAPEDARTACRLWAGAIERGILVLIPNEEVLPAAIELALKLAHPLQDCLYLALAEREHSVLITADPKFHARAQRAYASVEMLGLGE